MLKTKIFVYISSAAVPQRFTSLVPPAKSRGYLTPNMPHGDGYPYARTLRLSDRMNCPIRVGFQLFAHLRWIKRLFEWQRNQFSGVLFV